MWWRFLSVLGLPNLVRVITAAKYGTWAHMAWSMEPWSSVENPRGLVYKKGSFIGNTNHPAVFEIHHLVSVSVQPLCKCGGQMRRGCNSLRRMVIMGEEDGSNELDFARVQRRRKSGN